MKYPQINVPVGAVKYYPHCHVFIDGENKRMGNGVQPITGNIIRFTDRKDFINETFELEFIFECPKPALSRDGAIKLLAALEHNPFVSAELNELKQYGWRKSDFRFIHFFKQEEQAITIQDTRGYKEQAPCNPYYAKVAPRWVLEQRLGLKDSTDDELFNAVVELIPKPIEPKQNKYNREVKGVTVDVYDVLKAFNVTCPATQHALKKMLCAGLRGHKDIQTDLDEAIASLQRAKELV